MEGGGDSLYRVNIKSDAYTYMGGSSYFAPPPSTRNQPPAESESYRAKNNMGITLKYQKRHF